jgi:hypothetical protein
LEEEEEVLFYSFVWCWTRSFSFDLFIVAMPSEARHCPPLFSVNESRSKSTHAHPRTSPLLKSLTHLVINCGALVLACQILLVTFFASSGHFYWLALQINTTKPYVNPFCECFLLFILV